MKMEDARRRMGLPLLPNPSYGRGGGTGGGNRGMRKGPLSDCTNTARNSTQLSSSSTASVLKPQSKPNFSVHQSNSQLGNRVSKMRARNPSSSPVTAASTAPSRPPTKPSSASGRDQREAFDPVQTRGQAAQKTKNKGKTAMVPLISSPSKRIGSTGDKPDQDQERSLSKSSALPKKRKQYCRREQDDSKKALKDYIQQQRSYYAEIDAFELPEEEVDSIAALE